MHMKLKPGLFQLSVIIMTVSLLASCTRLPETSQSNCDHPQTAQQPYNCDNSSSHGSSRTGYRGSGYKFGSSSHNDGSSSRSPSKVGRGGFGSFGRGGHAGG